MKIFILLTLFTLQAISGSWSSSLSYSKITGDVAEDRDHNGLLGFNFGYNHDLSKRITLGADLGFSVNFADLDEGKKGHVKSMFPLLAVGRYYHPLSSNLYPFIGLGLGVTLMKLDYAPEDSVSSFTIRPSLGMNFGQFSVELCYSLLGKHKVYDQINFFSGNTAKEKNLNALSIMLTWGFHRMGMTDNKIEEQRKKLEEMEKKETLSQPSNGGATI